ncbi:PREDICTED: putative protein phosphatase 2C-like protein 44 [Nelumbo nucifera]|uniref:Uncharacterized protein n=2 Tax=Nelumbo nucifera TaxID=4432 RepID=A0A1U8ABX4_NELNU|nr:PREDICTED: putative protein phosphatase 2C-like protein 44 [Nelumbo nucifera]DAD19993.1 TPA_asm: hypothetical protein HUJ06_021456 [Nelumbo nucifera]
MGLKDFTRKLKAFRLRRFLKGNSEGSKRASWMNPVSHGIHVINDDRSEKLGSDNSGLDRVVVRREQVNNLEVWVFGVFDAEVGDGVTKYLQSQLFDKKLKESHIRRKSKETMRKAHLYTRLKMHGGDKGNRRLRKDGSASAIVINGEKVVIGNMGDYRAVVCRDGLANQINKKHQRGYWRHWSLSLITGALMPKVRILACELGIGSSKPSKSSEPAVGVVRIDSDTEFIILGSNGIWEVMRNQEAVDLIRHIENAQQAAEWLAKEALMRMSKSQISCIVIRFD